MAWLAVNKNGEEYIYETIPERFLDCLWVSTYCDFQDNIRLPKGSIKKLIGRELKWSDSPVEI